jgi:hypothetical protein
MEFNYQLQEKNPPNGGLFKCTSLFGSTPLARCVLSHPATGSPCLIGLVIIFLAATNGGSHPSISPLHFGAS